LDQGLLTTLGRRSSQRVCLHSDVGILDEDDGSRSLGRLRDLSATGASLATTTALPIGKKVRLAFEYEPGETPIRLHGEIVWSGPALAPKETTLSGLSFSELDGADFKRLRGFIDRKLWDIQRFLVEFDLFADMSDLERLLLASVVVERSLEPGNALEECLCEGTLAIVRHGTLTAQETLPDLRTSERRTVGKSDVIGAFPIDPRGLGKIALRAKSDSSLLIMTADSFVYLNEHHAELALKLLSAWALSLRDRLMAVEPS
jgi:hypothetical protein